MTVSSLEFLMEFYVVTIQVKATEQYFPVVPFIMLYKVVQTFESVDEILYSASRGPSIFLCSQKSYCVTIQLKATEQYFPVVLFIMLCMVVLTFQCMGKILRCNHSVETSLSVLSHGTSIVKSNSCKEILSNFCPTCTMLRKPV